MKPISANTESNTQADKTLLRYCLFSESAHDGACIPSLGRREAVGLEALTGLLDLVKLLTDARQRLSIT